MEKKIILRGALVGALAGLLAFMFARIFAEPQIQAAIDYESGRETAQAALDKGRRPARRTSRPGHLPAAPSRPTSASASA